MVLSEFIGALFALILAIVGFEFHISVGMIICLIAGAWLIVVFVAWLVFRILKSVFMGARTGWRQGKV